MFEVIMMTLFLKSTVSVSVRHSAFVEDIEWNVEYVAVLRRDLVAGERSGAGPCYYLLSKGFSRVIVPSGISK